MRWYDLKVLGVACLLLLCVVAACQGDVDSTSPGDSDAADGQDVDGGSDGGNDGGNDADDVCFGITCSGHGQCRDDTGQAQCHCDLGYEAQELNCVAMADWYAKQAYNNPAAEHTFEPGHGGTVHIAFDIIPEQAPIDGVIGYTEWDRTITSSTSFNVIVRLAPEGRFDARDGSGYAYENDIGYTQGQSYHVRLQINVSARTYDAWVTPPAGAETVLASGYAFRADADNNIDNIGKLFLRSENGDDLYRVRHHIIGGTQPCAEGPITSNCLCGTQEHDSGSCCSGVWTAGSVCLEVCDEGAITSACLCGAIERDSGACCEGVWYDRSQCPLVCAEGPITDTCTCGASEHNSGSCCGGSWVNASDCPVVCTQGEITQACLCGGTLQQAGDGYCCSGSLQASACPTEVLAFPGAEGWGARITGGRGGQVIRVTTLNATGPGSLQEALSTSGARIVVFAVSGVINGDLVITQPDVTIAGQTAPGAGITIAGSLYTDYCDRDVRNIIIRHLRIRLVCSNADNTQCDAVQFSCASEFVLDHVSISWGIDENLDLYSGAHTFTIQDCSIENPCLGPPDSEFGGYHNYGMLNGPGGGRGSVIRTAFINSKSRNPALADGSQEVINNLVYSYRLGFIHNNPASGTFNVIGNYFRKGPQFSTPGGSQPIAKLFYLDDEDTSVRPSYYFEDNYLDDFEEPLGSFNDPWTTNHSLLGQSEILAPPTTGVGSPHDYTGDSRYYPPEIMASAQVMAYVVARAGAFPRDIVSLDTMSDVTDLQGQFGCPNRNANLMTGLNAGTEPADNDTDGMADAWESANGLNPNDGSDHSQVMPSGYTAIEEYINGLADSLVP